MPRTEQKKAKAVAEPTLQDLLVNSLKLLYDAETQLAKALPKLAKKADDAEFRKGLENHAKQTERHAERIEQAFDGLGLRPQKLAGATIRGLLADAEWVLQNVKGPAAADAGLLAAVQSIEHYEMAGYECAIVWAKFLDHAEVGDLLRETFDEEAEMSDELTELAAAKIDEAALPQDESDEEADGEEDDEDEDEEEEEEEDEE